MKELLNQIKKHMKLLFPIASNLLPRNGDRIHPRKIKVLKKRYLRMQRQSQGMLLQAVCKNSKRFLNWVNRSWAIRISKVWNPMLLLRALDLICRSHKEMAFNQLLGRISNKLMGRIKDSSQDNKLVHRDRVNIIITPDRVNIINNRILNNSSRCLKEAHRNSNNSSPCLNSNRISNNSNQDKKLVHKDRVKIINNRTNNNSSRYHKEAHRNSNNNSHCRKEVKRIFNNSSSCRKKVHRNFNKI